MSIILKINITIPSASINIYAYISESTICATLRCVNVKLVVLCTYFPGLTGFDMGSVQETASLVTEEENKWTQNVKPEPQEGK